MKGTILFFIILIAVTFVISDFNHRVGYTPVTVVINTTYLLSIVYISSIVSVKDIQKLMSKQKKKDHNISLADGGD